LYIRYLNVLVLFALLLSSFAFYWESLSKTGLGPSARFLLCVNHFTRASPSLSRVFVRKQVLRVIISEKFLITCVVQGNRDYFLC